MNRIPPPPINPSFQPSEPPPLSIARSPQSSNADLKKFGIYLGVNISKNPAVKELVREAIKTPLPTNWKQYESNEGDIYYHNERLQLSTWEHPTDPFYRDLIKKKMTQSRSRSCVMM
jgi:hypothetical protein